MWQKSGLLWSEFLSDADKVDEFLAKHVSQSSSASCYIASWLSSRLLLASD